MARPTLNSHISVKDFQEFYWLRDELTKFCKDVGIDSSGSKIEITQRIVHYLTTGHTIPTQKVKTIVQSRFNWNTESLTKQTVITDSYKNTENVRRFFEKEIGKTFSFNVSFMNWLKANAGKTLADAIHEWNRITELKKRKDYKTEIAPQFEYNQYMRAFMADNPGMTIKDAMKYWKLKIAKRGTNAYEREDLTL